MRSFSGCIVFACLIASTLTVAPTPGRAGGVGVSSSADIVGAPAAQADTTKIFFRYRVPVQQGARARRDLEFLWSPRYQSLGKPLDPGTGAENDLDRLGKSICEIEGANPFGFPFTDIRLVFDYLNFANATYNRDPQLGSV